MRILLIGGTRFIGPAVARNLRDRGHQVTLFHRAQPDMGAFAHIQGNCNVAGDLTRAIEAVQPHVLIHMVAYAEDQIAVLAKALQGGAMKTVVISSADVYKGYEVLTGLSDADCVPGVFAEQSPLRDVLYPYRGRRAVDFAYSYEKIRVEKAALQAPRLQATVLRLGMVYGEHDPNRRFGEYIHQMAAGRKTVEIKKGMAQFQSCKCYVENVAYGICLAAERGAPGEIYNVADEPVFTELAWARMIAKKMDWTGEIRVIDEEVTEMNVSQHLVLDTSKIRKDLGYREIVGTDKALSNTIGWELGKR